MMGEARGSYNGKLELAPDGIATRCDATYSPGKTRREHLEGVTGVLMQKERGDQIADRGKVLRITKMEEGVAMYGKGEGQKILG